MIKLDAFHPIFIDLAMSFKILNSTASLQLIARPINMGSIYPILYQNTVEYGVNIVRMNMNDIKVFFKHYYKSLCLNVTHREIFVSFKMVYE